MRRLSALQLGPRRPKPQRMGSIRISPHFTTVVVVVVVAVVVAVAVAAAVAAVAALRIPAKPS